MGRGAGGAHVSLPARVRAAASTDAEPVCCALPSVEDTCFGSSSSSDPVRSTTVAQGIIEDDYIGRPHDIVLRDPGLQHDYWVQLRRLGSPASGALRGVLPGTRQSPDGELPKIEADPPLARRGQLTH